MSSKKISVTKSILYLLLFIAGCIFLWPFIYVISSSLSSDAALAKYGNTLIPREISLDGYRFILGFSDRLMTGLKISVFITLIGTFLSTIITSMIAYALSHKNLPYRTVFMKGIFVTMLFNGGLIPFFLVVKQVGLMNSVWSLILPVVLNTWNLILMRNFFMELPDSLEESAICDGANYMQILINIILPISKPIIATIALFYAVGYWNSWFLALLFLSDMQKYPAMLILRQILTFGTNPMQMIASNLSGAKPPTEPLKMACTVVITAPILLSYPFAQKYFVKGVMIGSIKG